MSAGTTYYVRTYAINSVGTTYGEEIRFKTISDTVGNGLPCPGIPTVSDIDGNIYNTVKFLGKCWMKENLKTTRYADGSLIASGDSFSYETPYRYAPDNDTNNIATYGYLYNWPAVMNGSVSNSANSNGVQGVCPDGWHVPNYEDLFGIPSPFMESSMCSDENDDRFDEDEFQQVGNYACFWCSKQYDYEEAYFRGIANGGSIIGKIKWKSTGMSVRCVLNEGSATFPVVTTNTVSDITSSTATCGGNVTSDGSAIVTERGVCWSTSQNPTISGSKTTNGSGTGSFTSSITGLSAGTTYYVRAYATNSAGTSYGNEVSFTTATIDGQPCSGTPTFTDIDGNIYNTVKIGNQCWMKENLRTTRYANGTTITLVQNSSNSTTTAYRYIPGNLSDVAIYGYLYNWKAVIGNSISSSTNPSGVQGVCPAGWHVPSLAEWMQLINYVSGNASYYCGNDSSNIAKSLASITGWDSASGDCTIGNGTENNNTTGFSILPVGFYYFQVVTDSYTYLHFGNRAQFWSATEVSNNNLYAASLRFSSFDSTMVLPVSHKKDASSVRCLRN